MNRFLVLIIVIIGLTGIWAADIKDNKVSEETVTLLESTRLNDAVQMLESLSWKYSRKKMINLSSLDVPIAIPIHNMPWRTALDLIALKLNLVIEESVGVVYIKDKSSIIAIKPEEEKKIDIHAKQVKISAIAFIADKAYLKSLGIDWSTLLDGKVSANVSFAGAAGVPGDILTATAGRTTTFDGKTIEVNTLLKVIESNQLGSIIARPIVTVSSGKKGYIQVGQDVSVKSVDDAGNTIDKFFATGVILEVEPTVIIVDNSEVIHLIASVERSAATPGNISTVVNKSKAFTEIILYNTEETVIGGLFDTDEIKTRSGIPFLRDLPWWVFGIRYLTGYYKIEKKERELIIIIKAEVMDEALKRQSTKG